MRLIDADALIERLDDFNKWCKDERLQGSLFVVDVVGDMPTVCDIPDNATNGDIIEKIFNTTSTQFCELVRMDNIDNGLCCSLDWWNSLYKR